MAECINITDISLQLIPIEGVCLGPECCSIDSGWNLNTFTCEYEDQCSTDLDNDGAVSASDILILLSQYGNNCDILEPILNEYCQEENCCGINTTWCDFLETCVPQISCIADFNNDFSVSAADVIFFLTTFSSACNILLETSTVCE